MILTDMAQYLHNQGLVTYDPTGTTGDCFIHTIPDQPQSAVGLFQYGGSPSDDWEAYDTVSIQIVVRGTEDPRPVAERAQRIYDQLQGFEGAPFIIGGQHVVGCHSPNGGIIGMGKGSVGRQEFRINFDVYHLNRSSMHREG